MPEYWCYDTVQKRRSQIFGRVARPSYYFFADHADHADHAGDAQSLPLTAFTETHVLSTGTNQFNADTTLVGCPGQPTSLANKPEFDQNMRRIELLEAAHDLGASGEKDQ